MENTFKLEIDAVSPDGNAVNCQSNIKVKCPHGMAVTVIANLLKQEKQLKMIFAEAVLIAISDVEVTQKISSDEFLDSILKVKEKQTEL
jgi:hypothetical protein